MLWKNGILDDYYFDDFYTSKVTFELQGPPRLIGPIRQLLPSGILILDFTFEEHAMSQTSVKTWMETYSVNILFLHVTDVYMSLLNRFHEVTSFTD